MLQIGVTLHYRYINYPYTVFTGEVYIDTNETANLTDVEVSDNYAIHAESSGNLAYGGGIYVNGGTANLTNSTITDNESLVWGSGLCAENYGTITLKNTAIYDNMYGTDVNLGKSGSAKPTFKVDGKVTLYEEEDFHRVQTGWVYDWDDNAEGTSFSTTDNLPIFLDQGFRSTWESEPHTPGKPVEENRVGPRVGVAGSYDELVTVSAVREFLGNFADVFGKQAVAAADLKSLTGADDEAVVNCDEVLAEFFGE